MSIRKGTATQVTKKLSQDFDKAVAADDAAAMEDLHDTLNIAEAIRDVFGGDCEMFIIPPKPQESTPKENE